MFTGAVLKLTAFCNLNCTYCYMFNQRDRSYLRVPKMMTLTTALRCLDRIEEHAITHDVRSFDLSLHGGEPTLWPLSSFHALLTRVGALRGHGLEISVGIQTNCYKRLDPALLELCSEFQTIIGISLDGPPKFHDLARVSHDGRGSYEAIMYNVEDLIARGYKHLLSGFLCVARPEIPPHEFLAWADRLPVRRLDILWPMHYNHSNPPWRDIGLAKYRERPRYGAWFADIFEDWFRRDDPTLEIPLFFDCIEVLLGSGQHGDNLVNDTIPLLVVNTDGGIERHDYFRSYDDGACRTAYNVHEHVFAILQRDPVFDYALNIGRFLPSECSGCPHRSICGGGFLPGRVTAGELVPTRKSVLCEDEFHYFTRIRAILRPHLDQHGAAAQALLGA